jgi:hypothetical protein
MLALAAAVIYRDVRSYISAPNYTLNFKKDKHFKTVEYFH